MINEQNVDLQDITDINRLKVMAYDQLAALEQIQANLQAINGRIAQLQQQFVAPAASAAKPAGQADHDGRVTRPPRRRSPQPS